MKYKPNVTYQYDNNISKEEGIQRAEEAYNILFSATTEKMEKSSSDADIDFLKKFPWLKNKN